MKACLFSLQPFTGLFNQHENISVFLLFFKLLFFFLFLETRLVAKTLSSSTVFANLCDWQHVISAFCLSSLLVYEDNNSPSGFKRLNSLMPKPKPIKFNGKALNYLEELQARSCLFSTIRSIWKPFKQCHMCAKVLFITGPRNKLFNWYKYAWIIPFHNFIFSILCSFRKKKITLYK